MKRDEAMKPCPLCQRKGFIDMQCPICKGFGEVPDPLPSVKKKKKNDISRFKATRAHKPFTNRDWRIIGDERISAAKAAKRLGRSIKAIENARYRLRRERLGDEERKRGEYDTNIYGS